MIPTLEVPRSIRVASAAHGLPFAERVSALEGNVRQLVASVDRLLAALGAWAAAVRVQAVTPWTPTEVITSTYRARIGELVRVDTTAAEVIVVLPPATPETAGQSILVKRVAGSNGVSCAPSAGNTVNLLTTAASSTRQVWVSDGAGDWSAH